MSTDYYEYRLLLFILPLIYLMWDTQTFFLISVIIQDMARLINS
jgi:hypothetical protein